MLNKPTAAMRRRLFGVIGVSIILFAVAIVLNLFAISLRDSKKYQELANNQQFASRIINANRGSILDANGTVLAQSATVYNVFIDPGTLKKQDMKNKDLIVNTLSQILGVDKEFIIKRCEKSSGYEIIKRKVEKPVADKVTQFVAENEIACIGCDPDTRRFYPQNDLAATVIGFTGFEGHGQYGLEQYYDKYLTGIDGKIISAEDAMGQQMPYRYEQSFAAKDGNNLILNIDANIQYFVETELDKAVSAYAPNNRACAIVMNPKTGQILAMATENDYDLNEPTTIEDPKIVEKLSKLTGDEYDKQYKMYREKQWKNKAITELYNPGSVFKVITGASALEEKVIDLNTTFSCGGSMTIGGEIIRCWKHEGHGTQNFVQALTNSCNPAFMQIGAKLGINKFSDYYNSFGFTETTGIDLPSEAQSIYRQEEDMTELDLAVSSFGQSHKITPIQMITAYAAVVNGGHLVTPYVANRIEDQNGNVIEQFEPKIKRQVISEETSKIMREALESVVVTNGGNNAYIQGYRIGGKSGTSQKIDEYGIVKGKTVFVGSFAAFAPADDPELIMLCIVDEPDKDIAYYGSRVAAPAVSGVFEKALPYIGRFKEYTPEEMEKLNVNLPDLVGKNIDAAKATLNELGLTPYRVPGNGDVVVKQIPERGSVPKGGKIYLYTSEENISMVTVPDVRKLSLQDANTILVNAGLNILPKGGAANQSGALATDQTHVGEKVPKGTIIEVTFMKNDDTG